MNDEENDDQNWIPAVEIELFFISGAGIMIIALFGLALIYIYS